MKKPCITPNCPYGVGPKSIAGLCNKCVKERNARMRKLLIKESWTRTIREPDLQCLQRYNLECEWMDEDNEGEYVRWDALIQLLK